MDKQNQNFNKHTLIIHKCLQSIDADDENLDIIT